MAGIKFRNANNFVVIDDRFANLAVIAKGSLTLDRYDSYSNINSETKYVQVNGVDPIVAFKVAKDYIRSFRVTVSPGVFRFYFPTRLSPSSATYRIPITYWVFDNPKAAPPGVGFRIRNRTTGAVVFDSRLRYMKVVGQFSRSLTFPLNYPGYTYSYAVGYNNIAIAITQNAVKTTYYGGGQGAGTAFFSGSYTINANQVILSDSIDGDADMQLTTDFTNASASFIVIDVTGL